MYVGKLFFSQIFKKKTYYYTLKHFLKIVRIFIFFIFLIILVDWDNICWLVELKQTKIGLSIVSVVSFHITEIKHLNEEILK